MDAHSFSEAVVLSYIPKVAQSVAIARGFARAEVRFSGEIDNTARGDGASWWKKVGAGEGYPGRF